MNKIDKERWLSLEDLPNEEWRPIQGYEQSYEISNFGRVKALERKVWIKHKHKVFKERIIKPWLAKIGYYMVSLCKNGKVKKILQPQTCW